MSAFDIFYFATAAFLISTVMVIRISYVCTELTDEVLTSDGPDWSSQAFYDYYFLLKLSKLAF